MYRNTSCL
ncbi:Defective in cullin neddylation protein [Zea mays]|uniref:Defective in cullin neddylation protein n=1 Tax=Zea mays TaxID=4577 RepID=A0A1D6EZA0_MAIZE|nr:Defective in cullin neddylation protein [Zea mays]